MYLIYILFEGIQSPNYGGEKNCITTRDFPSFSTQS